MRQKIISNLLSSGIEKIFILGIQFVSSIILIRLLPREDYGVIGVVAGYFVFVAFINISFESIILRDHKKYDNNLKNIMQTFFMVNLLKSILFIFIAVILTYILPQMYENSEFIYAIWAITFIMIADSITAPLTIYFASKFNQKLVTKVSIFRYVLSLILLFGLFIYPELWYIALKDFIVSCIFVLTWFIISYKKLHFRPRISKVNFKFLSETFFSYSLWTHLNGVITNFIYRSDTFFLSFFVSLTIVGNYNIALNSANIANIIPSILNYQNSIALSNVKGNKDKEIKITNYFLFVSMIVGVFTLILFYLLSSLYLLLITGENNLFIENILLIILSSLVISKIFLSPIISYLSIIHCVKDVTKLIYIPSLLISIITYYLMAKLYGGYGIAYANIIVAIFTTSVGIYIGVKNGWKFKFNKEMMNAIISNNNGKK